MKYSEIVELTTKELKEMISVEYMSYTKMKIAHSVSPLDNPIQLKDTRRKIAKLKTELRKRELGTKLT